MTPPRSEAGFAVAMKPWVAALLICPSCLPREIELLLGVEELCGDEIVRGFLECPACGIVYPISQGIANLLPVSSGALSEAATKYEHPPVVSSYLWSHYADLFADPDVLTSYADWSALFDPAQGLSLDVGCAAGRFTFELCRKTQGAVGIDSSRNLVQAARELMKHRKLVFPLFLEGKIHRPQTIHIPPYLGLHRRGFPPGRRVQSSFQGRHFSLRRLIEPRGQGPSSPEASAGNQPGRREGGCPGPNLGPLFLVPGSSRRRPVAGWKNPWRVFRKGVGEHPRESSEGTGKELNPAWHVVAGGSLWWKIRHHENHFELIRSCFIKAGR